MYLSLRASYFFKALALCLLLLLGAGKEGYGQDKKRTYANFQGNLQSGLKVLGGSLIIGEITAPQLAVDDNPKTASTLKIGAGLLGLASSIQFLEFTDDGTHSTARTISANTPVTIKFTIPQSVLGLVDGISVGIFRDLNPVPAEWPLFGLLGPGHNGGYDTDQKTELYSGSNLLNLLNGMGEVELTLTPNESFNGIYLELQGNALSLALTANISHAYILEDYFYSDCNERNQPIDVLSGVRAGTALGGIASATGSVTNPWNAVDNDPNTFALMTTGAQVLSEVFHTTIFQTPSSPGDIAKIILQDKNEGVLELALLKGFTIQPYLGAVPVGQPILNSSSLLSLRLFDESEHKYELYVPVIGVFDRIEIKMGGLADVLTDLNIYEVTRILAPPEFLDMEIDQDEAYQTICPGTDVELKIKNPIAGITYRWYDSEVGGNILHTGATYSLANVAEAKTFYVGAIRNDCVSSLSKMRVLLKEITDIIIQGGNFVCEGDNITLNASLPGGLWESSDVSIATINTTGQVTGLKTGEVTITYRIVENGCDNVKNKIITVHPKPPTPHVQINTNSQY